ncbi:uncharacterized protein PGTG_06026 [Puccinia graminis f. sp. tritici CRL 75-36-700-3]|uniref:Uncharacterized protein n=1 Tax=Puccinia graminis f. sp. tritici (strain CRL 75-36-700-3 / race SCCL) TaxID=418459 RepID=E3K5A9_PUCGT|nr:uncharacterized protein PGTG_06026 [Puccinia graminis f. sp. tritici CRL 75-36-700-3]EFP79705.2 hypothetical protein PGTG_06026 [Puccinia graminis f. sp. tritici CRL 75-36-700-3]
MLTTRKMEQTHPIPSSTTTTTTNHNQRPIRTTIQPPDRIQLIKATHPNGINNNRTSLPFTTSLSRLLFKLLSSQNHQRKNTSLINRITEYLSLLLIRELATLEDLFIKSPIYRLLKFLTPSILPKSSTYPFLLTLILGGIQLKKLWKHQQQLVFNLLISLGPLLNTLRLLTHIQIDHDRIQSRHTDPDHELLPKDQHLQELRRWSLYWLVYCTLINLENLKLSTSALSNHLSPIISRPTIYPNITPIPNQIENIKDSYPEKVFQLFKNLASQSSRHFFHLLPTLIKPAPSPSVIRKNIPPRLPIESFDLHTHPTITSHRPVQVYLPEYLFGKDRRVYGIIKLGFLRWCSSDRRRGCEKIWTHLLGPIVSVIGRSDRRVTRGSKRRMKVVQVTIDTEDVQEEDEEEQDPTDSSSGPAKILPHRPPSSSSRTHHPAATLPDHPLRPEEPPESPASASVRRIRSDPTPARWEPTGRPAHALALSADHDQLHSDPTDLSSAHPTLLDHTHPHPLIDHSASCDKSPHNLPLSHKQHPNCLAKVPHPIDFKTPENAWNTLSFIG